MEESYVKEKEGINAFREVVEILEQNKIDYWLGRGLLRHFTLHKELGNKLSDIDFHIWEKDKEKLIEILKNLKRSIIFNLNFRSHKAQFRTKNNTLIEIVYLKENGEKACHKSKKRILCCNKTYFDNRRMKIFNIDVRVPSEEYLSEIYGKNWRAEKNE